MAKVKLITQNEMFKVIDKRKPKGIFICREDDLFVACDNRTGDAWTQDFKTKEQAIKWLKDEN